MEYNADTPSLIVESSMMQEEWYKNQPQDSETYQSNYLNQALNDKFQRIVSECQTPGVMFTPVDQENVAQMNLFRGYMNRTRKV